MHVWGRYGGELGWYDAGIVFHRDGQRLGVIKQGTVIDDDDRAVAHCRNGDLVLQGGRCGGHYTGDESGAAAAFLLYLHRKRLRAMKSAKGRHET